MNDIGNLIEHQRVTPNVCQDNAKFVFVDGIGR